MKILIFSDVHGSVNDLKKILELEKSNNFDKVIVLGDLLNKCMGSGWSSEENGLLISSMLNSFKDKIIAIRGNCDTVFDEGYLEFKLEDYVMIEVDFRRWFLSHGHQNEIIKGITACDILLNGHTHISKLSNNEINPGSISLPRKNTTNSYIIYEDNKFNLYDLNDNKLIEQLQL